LHNIKTYILIALCLLMMGFTQLQAVNYQIHTVKKGDTLYGLSKRYGVTVKEIQTLNNLSGSKLSIGQELKIKPEEPKPKTVKKPVPKVTTKTETTPKPVTSVPASTPASTEEPDANRLASLPEEYYHLVLPKENLYRIALNANIKLSELLRYNDFEDENVVIHPGQKVIIKDPATYKQPVSIIVKKPDTEEPVQTETSQITKPDSVLMEKVYIVQRKDTLFKIARENNMTVEELKRLNHLTSNAISVGQKLYIVTSANGSAQQPVPEIITEEDLKAKVVLRTDLIMPVDGKILSEYGIRNGRPHKGIDLGAPNGTPVFAVLDGTVVYSGLQGNYGNVVVLEHPDYVMTVYAHSEKNLVVVGESIKQGQIIATVGSTGNATAPHVHFEYRIKGKAINPRKVLPLGK